MTFDSLGLIEPLLRAVAHEGYTTPTPIQIQTIPHLLAGRDLLGCAQTGTGKTAAFALPILQRLAGGKPLKPGRKVRALILSPTRELTLQIRDSFALYGRYLPLRGTAVVGGVNQNPQVRMLRQGADVLVATPGRLLDLMGQGLANVGAVETFVLDEADRMLDMGFIPDVRRIIAQLPRERQTLLFSATMPEAIESLAQAILHDPVQVRVTPARSTETQIEQSVYFVPKQEKAKLLARLLNTLAVTRALVFTRTKHGADRLAKHLNRAGIRAEAIHGDKSQNARIRALTEFKSEAPPVLVATDIAARGIDVDGISHVLNYDLPQEPETYVHRIGRTGRAGATGTALSFCDHEERKLLVAIERLLRRELPVEENLLPPDSRPQPRPQRSQRPQGARRRIEQPADDTPQGPRTTQRPSTAVAGASRKRDFSRRRKAL